MLRKLFFYSILLILILFVVLAVYVLSLNPDQYKSSIIDEVKLKTGQTLKINGHLSWTLYPLFGVKANNVQLFAPNQASPWADLNKAILKIKPLALIHREFQSDSITFYNVHFYWNNHQQLQLDKLALRFPPAGLNTSFPLPIQLNGQLYQGNLNGKVIISKNQSNYVIASDANLTNIQTKTLLKDIIGNDNFSIQAVGNVQLHINTTGTESNAFLNNLTGQGTLHFNQLNVPISIKGQENSIRVRLDLARLFDQVPKEKIKQEMDRFAKHILSFLK